MAVTITDYRKNLDKELDKMEQLANSYVLVGFQEGSVTKSEVRGTRRKEAGKSQAQIAAENEFGTRIIPARPFMGPAIDDNRDRINNVIVGEYVKILDGTSNIRKSLNLIGLFAVTLIQKKIRDIRTPPNSPRTIALKKSSKPLIDFGQMIQSVRHKIVIPK